MTGTTKRSTTQREPCHYLENRNELPLQPIPGKEIQTEKNTADNLQGRLLIKVIALDRDAILAISASGNMTDADYTNVIIPALEDKLRSYPQVRLLYHLGTHFRGYAASSTWNDAKLGLQFQTAFEKIAFVSEVPRAVEGARLIALLVPCPTKIFPNSRLADAEAWLME